MTAKRSEQRSVENIMKLVDEYAAAKYHYGHVPSKFNEPRERLLAAVEELYASLAKDARRYRFLKENIEEGYEFCGNGYMSYRLSDDPENWDRTIDAAMKGQS